MFDPFGDFDTEGYLRNFDKEKDLEIVKIAEHELFRAQLPVALNFLAKKKRIEYSDFLKVHQLLFEGLYPWAGKIGQKSYPTVPSEKKVCISATLASASLQSPRGCLSLMTKSK